MSLLSNARRLSVVISGFLLVFGCGDEAELPEDCDSELPGSPCSTQQPIDTAGKPAAAERDAGTPPVTRRSERQDAGVPPEDMFVSAPQCRATTFFFSPGCVSGATDPERNPTQIAASCYRPCTRARDSICSQGTRCGRASISSRVCSASTCTSICAEAWLCLPDNSFPDDRDAGRGWSWNDADAGRDPWLNDDAGS